MNNRLFIICALIFPILALLLSVGYREYLAQAGEKVILPIEAYDPRDILSGHYLTYRVNYGIDNMCSSQDFLKKAVFLCLDPKQFTYEEPQNCKVFIAGFCEYGRFIAGIERFYIPEQKIAFYAQKLREGNAKVVLSIKDGNAQVVDLLIE